MKFLLLLVSFIIDAQCTQEYNDHYQHAKNVYQSKICKEYQDDTEWEHMKNADRGGFVIYASGEVFSTFYYKEKADGKDAVRHMRTSSVHKQDDDDDYGPYDPEDMLSKSEKLFLKSTKNAIANGTLDFNEDMQNFHFVYFFIKNNSKSYIK